MNVRFTFQLEASDARKALPHKLLLVQGRDESRAIVLLRLLGYLLFFRERLQISADLHDDNIVFVPDLVQLDYQLRPVLWVECGDPKIDRLNRLAVKAPEAELWILRPSSVDAENLHRAMVRAGLRRNRYRIIGFDAAWFEELLGLLGPRNRVFWVAGTFDPPQVQFEFNGLWFDAEFHLLTF
jgi:hypothetical protein